MAGSPKPASDRLAVNRKALRDYAILEKLESGIELRGTEVKSVREGQTSLAGSYARIDRGELILHGMNIPPYEQGNRFNHEPARARRLLMHRREIHRLLSLIGQKGFTVVPLQLYLKRGRVKVQIGVCRGKKQEDKRETLKRKTADREAERAVSDAGKRRR